MMRTTAGLLLSLFYAVSVSAQAPVTDPANPEAAEEVIVTGQRSTLQLRLELMEAERAAYSIFNQFNDDRRFHISCNVDARTGSRFKRQLCQAEFEIQAMRGHAQDYLETMPSTPGDGRIPSQAIQQHLPVEMQLARHQKAYREKMRQVAEEHPEFLDALARYAALNDEYRKRTGATE